MVARSLPADRRCPESPDHRGGAFILVVIARFTVAAILDVLGASVKGQKPLQEPIVDRQLEQRAPRGVAAGQVAVFE